MEFVVKILLERYVNIKLKIVNGEVNGDIDAAWMIWNKSQGKINKGVINRRKTELRVYHDSMYVRIC